MINANDILEQLNPSDKTDEGILFRADKESGPFFVIQRKELKKCSTKISKAQKILTKLKINPAALRQLSVVAKNLKREAWSRQPNTPEIKALKLDRRSLAVSEDTVEMWISMLNQVSKIVLRRADTIGTDESVDEAWFSKKKKSQSEISKAIMDSLDFIEDTIKALEAAMKKGLAG